MDQRQKDQDEQKESLFVSMVVRGVLRWPPVPQILARLSRGRSLPTDPPPNTREPAEPDEDEMRDINSRR